MLARYAAPGGYRDVLRIGLPLVASLGSVTVMHFTDRVFLAHYSLDALAASMPSGIAAFLFTCFFIGLVSYVNVFVAQYTGAGRHEEVGPALWQGIWLALAAWVVLIALSFIGPWLFALADHPPEVRALEETYFAILMWGGGVFALESCLASFFTGRGLTRTVMVVNFCGMSLNVPLNACLIFGLGPFPEMGIAGAGLATVLSWGAIGAVYVTLIFRAANERQWRVRSGFALRPKLMASLLRYGAPGGAQFFLDLFAITFFSFMLGRVGAVELAASNLALALNQLAFLPMIGISIAVSTMVGQAIGAGRPDEGAYATDSAIHLALIWMGSMAALYVFVPGPLLSMFGAPGTDPATATLARNMLLFVAFYSLVDAVAIVSFGALKGAGDVFYVMKAMAVAAICVMILPGLLAVEVLGFGAYALWGILAVYVLVLGVVFRRRWTSGRWREFKVI